LLVEVDKKGRVLLPSQIRKRMPSRKFELRIENNSIIMESLPDPESIRGKYKGLLKGKSIWQVEEEQEILFCSLGSRKKRIA